jgi:hypothetical protein
VIKGKRRYGEPLPGKERNLRPTIEEWENGLCADAAVRIAHVVNKKYPAEVRSGKRGKPKDERGHHAGKLMREAYEEFLGLRIGHSMNAESKFGGPYYRSIKMVLDAIGSASLPQSIILEQKRPGARKNYPFNPPEKRKRRRSKSKPS